MHAIPLRRTIVLVACAQTKQDQACAASELYVSALFRKASAYARLVGNRWFVLSALHGLLPPDRIIEPYNVTLNGMHARERRQWADAVFSQLSREVATGDEIVILAGRLYRDDLIPKIESLGAICRVPLHALPIGRQLQWLTHAAIAHQPTADKS